MSASLLRAVADIVRACYSIVLLQVPPTAPCSAPCSQYIYVRFVARQFLLLRAPLRKPYVATLPAEAILHGKISRPAYILYSEQKCKKVELHKQTNSKRST